jgi:hypothetical protein
MQAGEGMALKECFELNPSLTLRQPKVHVEDMDDAIDFLMPNPEFGVEYATLLTSANGQIDVGRSHQRPPAENGIPILATAANLDIGKPGAMLELEELAKELDLTMAVRPPSAFFHFLEQHQVGCIVTDRLTDALWRISAIQATNALVNIVAEDTELHAKAFAQGGERPSSQ